MDDSELVMIKHILIANEELKVVPHLSPLVYQAKQSTCTYVHICS